MDRDELINAVETYRASVFRIAYGYTGNFEDAEDISQDVFLKLYQCKKQFQSEEHKKAWLIRVAVNASKSLVTSSWKKKRTELSDGKYESFNKPYYSDVNERELFDCVMRLAPKYRTVVYLFYYEDYSVEKVAKLMNISKSAVTTRLSRAREQLKNTFLREENGHEREYQKNV